MEKRINIILQLIFIAAITLTIWNGVEGVRLNERYERSIQRHEQSTKEYTEYLKNMKNQLQERKVRLVHNLNPKSS
ncbi:hypothetical protein BSK54_10270 [Paenibacillus odorifer]|uniref:hypothetical protein n=1 Tax=Paenibacillus odorifer TaxID=189426 RepID=UPI00096FE0DE|nr:hypothetical protein [Paenibacillus odorifer]OME02635.1 hypothetical protein BSK54_10270 [Paenibacillus odorifer]